jgi:hypothetical protein
MARRIASFAAALALASVVAGVAVGAVTVNQTDTIPIAVFIPCANGGAGEDVSGEIRLHTLITSTVNGNSVSGKFQFKPQGGSLVGETTGDVYRPTGVTQGTFTGSLTNGQFVETDVNNFRIIGPGTGNNLLVHDNFHITFTANGNVTVSHDNPTVDCK